MFEWIEFVCCFGEGITLEKVKTHTRKGEVVFTRQLIFYFSRMYQVGSLENIACRYGWDHATVVHSVKTINNYLRTDKHKTAKIDYYNSLIKKLKDLLPNVDKIANIIDPISKQISELEARSINLGLQIAFLKQEIEKLNSKKDEQQSVLKANEIGKR